MKVKSNTLADVKKADREKLRALLYERSVAKYAFSYRRLAKLLDSLDCPELNDALAACILGYGEEEIKAVVDDLNERIQAIYSINDLQASESGSITMLEADPFGRFKDFIFMSSQSSSFSQDRAIDALVLKYGKLGVKATDIKAIFESPAVTKKKPYVTVQARDHKEDQEPHDRKPR